jgi:hypothetical protein
MRCGNVQTIIHCSNPTGTTCTKVQSQVLVLNNNAACTSTEFIAVTNSEWLTASDSPFRLSMSEAGAIGAMIILVWATAWGVKALYRSIGTGEPERY